MLKYFVRDAFDTMSMGNYPFESNYIAGTEDKPMPTYPVSVACNYLKDASRALQLFEGCISVLYNVLSYLNTRHRRRHQYLTMASGTGNGAQKCCQILSGSQQMGKTICFG